MNRTEANLRDCILLPSGMMYSGTAITRLASSIQQSHPKTLDMRKSEPFVSSHIRLLNGGVEGECQEHRAYATSITYFVD